MEDREKRSCKSIVANIHNKFAVKILIIYMGAWRSYPLLFMGYWFQ